jgi:hypothetical protein
MQKKVEDVVPGDLYKGERVEAVTVYERDTVLYFGIGAIDLNNGTKVWVDASPLRAVELRDALGKIGGG